MPISFLVTWPRRQMIGSSQRGSALLRRPTLMRNHTISSPLLEAVLACPARVLAAGSRSPSPLALVEALARLAVRCRHRPSPRAPAAARGGSARRRWRSPPASARPEAPCAMATIFLGRLLGEGRVLHDALAVALTDFLGGGRACPFRVDAGRVHEPLGLAAAGIGHEQHADALAPGAARCGRCGAAASRGRSAGRRG